MKWSRKPWISFPLSTKGQKKTRSCRFQTDRERMRRWRIGWHAPANDVLIAGLLCSGRFFCFCDVSSYTFLFSSLICTPALRMGSFRFIIERKVETKERDLRLFSFEPYSTDSFSLSLYSCWCWCSCCCCCCCRSLSFFSFRFISSRLSGMTFYIVRFFVLSFFVLYTWLCSFLLLLLFSVAYTWLTRRPTKKNQFMFYS